MPNPNHLAILKEGVDAWNQWRRDNLDIRPDLQEADLREADLQGANLQGTILRDVDLRKASLYEANLRGATLYEANLMLTDFTLADLTGADLTGAKLLGTSFIYTSLEGAFLYMCEHRGPSTFNLSTLEKNPDLPLHFLQGCGLSDVEIEFYKLYRKDLTASEITDIGYEIIRLRSDPAIVFHSCFISYSSKNDAFARKLRDSLQNSGVRCWFAPEDIQSGKKLHLQITDAIRLHDKLLLILSEHSLQSNWVEAEIRRARRRERKEGRQMLFPVRLTSFDVLKEWELFDADEGRDLAAEVREYFIPDFRAWQNPDAYKTAFDKLLDDLRAS